MKVKGVNFLSRKEAIEKRLGKDRWEAFMEKLIEKEPYYANPVLPSSLIPAEKFITFIEMLTDEFFNGDPMSSWEAGRQAADWAFNVGPYQSLLKNKDLDSFIENVIPILWSLYFTEGKVDVSRSDNSITVRITNVPVRHITMEYSVLGFLERSFEILTGKKPKINREKKLVEDGEVKSTFMLTY